MGGLLALGLGWFAFGEMVTGLVWDPPGSAGLVAATLVATYAGESLVIKYPVVPWLAMMMLGWALGRHANNFRQARPGYRRRKSCGSPVRPPSSCSSSCVHRKATGTCS